MTIFYHLYFLHISTLLSLLHQWGQWGELTGQNATLYLHLLYWQKFVFLLFSFFF